MLIYLQDNLSFCAVFTELHYVYIYSNNYSFQAQWLSVNIHRNEVEVYIHHNHRAEEE